MEMELLGIPSVVLCTKPFVSQARAMSRMKGNPNYGLAIIDHPIITLSHRELLERAQVAAPQAIQHLVDQ
jgi:hypothetical protein